MKHKDQSKAVAANLRCLIERHGITHQQVADAIQNKKTGEPIRRSSVTALLNGRFSPSLDVLFQYLNAVNRLAGGGYELKDIQP